MSSTISEMGECLWEQDEDGNWSTGCGQLHVFFDGTPHQNEYGFFVPGVPG